MTDQLAGSQRDQAGPLSVDELEGLVTWTLVRAARRIERMLATLFAAHHLTPVQFGILAHLGTGAPLTQSQLARAVMIRPQSVNTAIADMIERGLLERTGPVGRGRRTPLAVTPAGVELLRTIQPSVRQISQPEHLGLDAAQAARLNETLHAVMESNLPTELERNSQPPASA